MNAQIATLISAGLAIAAVLYPDHPIFGKLSQQSNAVVQAVGAVCSILTSVGLFIAKPHPVARAAVIGTAQRIRAGLVLVWDILRGRAA